MTDTEISVLEGWAILELMGHRRLAGYISEVEFAGGKFVRIDVPDTSPEAPAGDGGRPPVEGTAATQIYGSSAIYCMTPTTEQIARAVAERSAEAAPVSRWELRALTPAEAKLAEADVGEDVYVDDTFG